MLGLWLAILSAFFWGTNDYLNKRLLIKGLDENFVLWVRFPIASLLLAPLGFYYWDMSLKLFLYSLIWLPLEVLGGVLFYERYKVCTLIHCHVFLFLYARLFCPFWLAITFRKTFSLRPSWHKPYHLGKPYNGRLFTKGLFKEEQGSYLHAYFHSPFWL